jgi:hypothetical protein
VEVLRVETIPPTNGWNPEGLCVTWAGRALDTCVGGTTCITERGKINQTRTSLRPHHGSVPDDCAELALRDL